MSLAAYRWLGVHAWSARQHDLLVELLAAAMGRFLESGAGCAVQADFLFGRCGVAAGVDRGGGAAPTGLRCGRRRRSRRGRRSYGVGGCRRPALGPMGWVPGATSGVDRGEGAAPTQGRWL